MTFELKSAHFDFVKGTLTILRQPEGEAITPPWMAEALEVRDGSVTEVDYDGGLGRLHLWFEGLQVRRRSDQREFQIPAFAALHDIVETEVLVQAAVVELTEHAVVTIQVVDASQRPLVNSELNVLTALPQPLSFGGRTNFKGEMSFLARAGTYSVVLGEARHPPIEILPSEADEYRLVINAGTE